LENKIVFLPGFLGSPQDWSKYSNYFSKKYKCITPSLLDIKDLKTFGEKLPSNAHLVGYSMGGRISLWLHFLFPKKFSSLCCISSNPGLKGGRMKRLSEDQKWLKLMSTLSVEDFIKKWYDQPMFYNCPIPKERMNCDLKRWSEILQKFTIAKQPCFWDDLFKIKIPVLFLFGERDEKYKQIGNRLNTMDSEINTKIIKNCSHVVHLEAPDTCVYELEKHLERCNVKR